MLELIIGKNCTGKTTKIYEKIKENLSNKEKIFLIVPEQSNLSHEQGLFAYLQTNSLLNIEVLTLSRAAQRIINDVGGVTKNHLSNSAKAMIIYDILKTENKNLKYLGKSDKTIDIVAKMITELKKHNIKIEDLENVDINNTLTKIKIEDIKLVYREYESRITNCFFDENDQLSIALPMVSKSTLFENSLVCIDDFNGFTPQEYSFFEEILKKTDDVSVAISTDSERIGDKTNDIFYFNKVFANNLVKIANKCEINYSTTKCDTDFRLKDRDLQYLADYLCYSNQIKPFDDVPKSIELFLANNSYSELEYVANKIINLVKETNLSYNEIAIITNDIDSYVEQAIAIFNKYNIPLFIDQKKDLNQNLIIQYILALIEVLAKNFSFDSVMNYIKIGLNDLEAEDLYEFENYCLKWGINTYKWQKEFNYEEKNELQDKFEELRQKIINPIANFKEEIGKNKTAKEISKCLYNYLIDNKIDEIINERLININDIEISNEYNTSYKIIIDVLNDIVNVFGDEKISFDYFKELLMLGFSTSELGKIPATQDVVMLGDSKRSRNSNIKVCFVIGVNDGVFPMENKFEGFLNDSDRETLKSNGIELAKTSEDATYESNYEIYNILTMARDKLFISYCSQNNESKSIRPALIIKKLRRAFPKMPEKSDIVNKDYFITNKLATFDDSIAVLKNALDSEQELSDEWKTVINYFAENEKNKLIQNLKALDYSNIAEVINGDNIKSLYGNKLFTSVSKLEQYRQCPFSFHLNYALKLKEREELKMQTIQTGNFMHEVIDTFFAKLEENEKSIKEITDEEVEKIVNDIIDEFLMTSRYYIFMSNAKYRSLTRKLKKTTKEVINYIVYTLRSSQFEVYGHELKFGSNEKFKPISFELENGSKVELIGKIDRLDIGKIDNKTYVRIIDYKSSIKNLDLKQVNAGLQIQLITYLDSVCNTTSFEPAGVLYSSLIDAILNIKPSSVKDISSENLSAELRKTLRMNGLVLADLNVLKMMDKNLDKGTTSDIIPVQLKNDGDIASKSSVISSNDFKDLRNNVNKVIKELSKEILNGNIDIKPYKYKQMTGCNYCKFKTICNFNPNFKDNVYDKIK